jgi:hypothetical protein
MNFQHVNVKIYTDGEPKTDTRLFIDVFHEWIQQDTLDEMLIDVADYRHVPAGPGVLLVGHEADYAMDNTDGRCGLRYNRKATVSGNNIDRFRQALASAAHACELLELRFASEGALRFSRQEFELYINDRALAPNTPETCDAFKLELESFLASAFGGNVFTFERQYDPRRLVGATVKFATPFDLQAIAGI